MRLVTLNVITHLHSKASNGPASSLDRVAGSILTEIFGTIPEGLIWRECFTDCGDLRQIIAGDRTRQPVDILFVTDHLSSHHHRLDDDVLRLAADERRIGIGGEIQTVCYSERHGGYLAAPEVLLYGDGLDRRIDGRPYTGIDNGMLAQLYEQCSVAGADEPEIGRVNAFCRDNRIACALAHPFDCHELDLIETLEVIGTFAFVETVNGGFPRASALALHEYAAFHNQVVTDELGVRLLALDLSREQRHLLNIIGQSAPLVPLGGSDAHLSDFDRVVTRFRTPANQTTAADFVRTMLHCPADKILANRTLEPWGRGISWTGLYRDVLGIVGKNIRNHWHHFRNPAVWPAMLLTLATTGQKEFHRRMRRDRSIATLYRRLEVRTLLQSAAVLGRQDGGVTAKRLELRHTALVREER
nr:hypothetical protein [uncultured Desulfobulbus sp.]